MTLIPAMALWLVALGGCTPQPGPTPPAGEDSAEPVDTVDESTLDQDGDGWTPASGDCDDTNSSIHPRAEELPDGLDQDCDGRIDERTVAYDDDHDGVTELEGDCDDADRGVWPGAPEEYACDGLDEDCSGLLEPCAGLDTALLRAEGNPDSAVAQAVAGGVDMTGDGRPDLLAYNGTLWVWSIPDAPATLEAPDVEAWVTADPNPYRPDALVILGDTDADGFPELAMGALDDAVYGLSAPLTGGHTHAEVSVATWVHTEGTNFGGELDGGRDASGDGVADLLIGAWYDEEGVGSVYLVSGDGRGLMDMSGALAHIHGEEDGDFVGLGSRFTGDNDGDGLEDLLVAGYGGTRQEHRAGWFSGPVQGSVTLRNADVLVESATEVLCFTHLPKMGDVDADGRDDLLLHNCDYRDERFYVFTGGLTGSVDDATARVEASQGAGGALGHAADVVDVNGDGLGDVVLGVPGSELAGWFDGGDRGLSWAAGAAGLFLSPMSGTYDLLDADRIWAGQTITASLGSDVEGVGDVNGDGFEDFALAAPHQGDPEDSRDAHSGAAYLLLGAADL